MECDLRSLRCLCLCGATNTSFIRLSVSSSSCCCPSFSVVTTASETTSCHVHVFQLTAVPRDLRSPSSDLRPTLPYLADFTIFITCVSYAEARNRYRLEVRPSVRLSVTRWHCIKTAEYIVMLSSPHDSPFILVLCTSRSSRNSGVIPCGGAKYRWGIKFARFSTNKSLYLANDTRYRHGCYGRRVGTHMRSIKWCHFQ